MSNEQKSDYQLLAEAIMRGPTARKPRRPVPTIEESVQALRQYQYLSREEKIVACRLMICHLENRIEILESGGDA